MKKLKNIIFILIGFAVILYLVKPQLPILYDLGQKDMKIAKVSYFLEEIKKEPVIKSVDTNGKKLVALSIDDGPDPIFTPQLLDILQRYKVKATLFVVGESAEAYPELVKRESKEGHELENHTYSHVDLRSKNKLETEAEIQKSERILESLTGKKSHYFRPPRKQYINQTLEVAKRNGYQTVLWTICVENSKAKTPEEMAQRVLNAARPGMIILAHDGRLDRSLTMEALPIIIEGLQKQGYEFVTLDELMEASPDHLARIESLERI